MAVGDIVNWLANSVTSYQPAAGIEIIIMRIFGDAGTYSIRVTDGVIAAGDYMTSIAPYQQMSSSNKIGITNTSYFQFLPSSSTRGFSGIQIK